MKKLDFARLKNPPMLLLAISALLGCVFGCITLAEGIADLGEYLDESVLGFVVRIVVVVVCFLICLSCAVFGWLNSLTGRHAKYVEIFHYLEFLLLFLQVSDDLILLPKDGFPECFGGYFGLVALILEVANLFLFAFSAEFTERLDKKARGESK